MISISTFDDGGGGVLGRRATIIWDIVSEELSKFDVGGKWGGCSRDDRASPFVEGLFVFHWLARSGATAHVEFETSYLIVLVNRPSLVYKLRMMVFFEE